jgi:hypothetical protein
MSKLGQFQEWSEDLNVPYDPYRAVIERVVDGDTVHVMLSLGLDEYAYRMIRIKGAFAPELFSGPPEERTWKGREGLSGRATPGGDEVQAYHRTGRVHLRTLRRLDRARGRHGRGDRPHRSGARHALLILAA